MDPKQAANDVFAQVVQWRRHFHRHPELGWCEHETQKFVLARLHEMNLSPRPAATTGVICDIVGERPGPTVALRADLDALAIDEETGLEFASTRPGVMHACGHDAHAAMLLGAARVLAAHRAELAGTIRLLFQPAEETVPDEVVRPAETGALAMVEDGAMDGVAAVYGIHVFSYQPVGTIEITPGPSAAGSRPFDIVVTGRGGHAGLPQNTVDALAVGAHLTVALRSVVSLGLDPLEPRVIHLGEFHSGQSRTAVAETARLSGTVRFLTEAMYHEIETRMQRAVDGVAASFGARAELIWSGHKNKPVTNDAPLAAAIAPLAAQVVGAERVITRPPMMGAEDFWHYLEQAPGVFVGLGGGNPDRGAVHGHHSPRFQIDEAGLRDGVEFWLRLAFANGGK